MSYTVFKSTALPSTHDVHSRRDYGLALLPVLAVFQKNSLPCSQTSLSKHVPLFFKMLPTCHHFPSKDPSPLGPYPPAQLRLPLCSRSHSSSVFLAPVLDTYLDSSPPPGLTSYCSSLRAQPENPFLKDSSLPFPRLRKVSPLYRLWQHTPLLLVTQTGNVADTVFLWELSSCALSWVSSPVAPPAPSPF